MITSLQPRVSTHHWALSAASHGKGRRARSVPTGVYSHLLDQDFARQVYAYEFGIEYDGVEYQDGNRIISGLLRELGQYTRDDATTLFPQLVSVVARDYLGYGRCVFELFNDNDGDTVVPRLGILPGWSLRSRRGEISQIAPSFETLEWLRLPRTALVEFRLPGQLGKELYRTSRRLQIIDASRPGRPDLLAGSRSTGYAFEAHQKSLDEMAAKATKSIGWDGRGSFLRRATNSYLTYRKLLFLRTWLTIVTAVTETLNYICSHAEVHAGTPLKIHVAGLPSVEDIERHMTSVINGTESLDYIFNTVLHPRFR